MEKQKVDSFVTRGREGKIRHLFPGEELSQDHIQKLAEGEEIHLEMSEKIALDERIVTYDSLKEALFRHRLAQSH